MIRLGANEIKVFFAACLYYSGLVKLARWWMQRSGQRLIILNYHGASEGDLRRHLLYLRRHYRMLHLEEALEELYTSKGTRGVRDRRTPLVLTFDDGYRDNYTHAFALARELRVPITIFLVPGYNDGCVAKMNIKRFARLSILMVIVGMLTFIKARSERRKEVRAGLSIRATVVEYFLAVHHEETLPPQVQEKKPEPVGRPKLKGYINE